MFTMILSCILLTILILRFTILITPPGIMAMGTITVTPTIIPPGDSGTIMDPGVTPA